VNIIRSFILAFSTFSKLPMPTVKWNDKAMRYLMVFFPFVGAAVGLVIWGWLRLCDVLAIGTFLRAAGLTLLPVAITGGIHLDGFCDTVDALSSRASQERKREILKDPHTGAFAVIGAVCYMLLYFALAAELQPTVATPLLLGLSYILVRTLSGLAVLLFPSVKGPGLAATFKASAHKLVSSILLCVVFIGAAAGLLITQTVTGGVMLAAALVCFFYLFIMSRRQFGGMSGDLAGFFLQITELIMLAALIITDKVGGLSPWF
jgi:adenosylcobinamide-GDP ribazoletransferase